MVETKIVTDRLDSPPSSNILVNGGFEMWLSGLTFSSVASSTYTADQWTFQKSGTITGAVAREGTTIHSGVSSLKLTLTGLSGSAAAHMRFSLSNYKDYLGKTLSISVAVNTNVASSIRAKLDDGISLAYSSFATTGAFTILTATIAVSASASRLFVDIGAVDSPDAQNSVTYIDSAMLTIGAPTAFVPTPRNVDFQRAGVYASYRRPTLGFGGITAIGLETELNGVSGVSAIMFPDGDVRAETDTTKRTFVITRNAVLTSSGGQSGLRSGLSEANNTWYFLYAVKITDSPYGFIMVGEDIQNSGNVATLNSRYGVNGWEYMGIIRNGDNNDVPGDILDFWMNDNFTQFRNVDNPSTISDGIWPGLELASSTSSTGISWAYSTGTTGTSVPGSIRIGIVTNVYSPTVNGLCYLSDNGRAKDYHVTGVVGNLGVQGARVVAPISSGFQNSIAGANGVTSIVLSGFWDMNLQGPSGSMF